MYVIFTSAFHLFIDIKVDKKIIHISNLSIYLVLYMVQSIDHVKYIYIQMYILKFDYRHHGMCLIEWNRTLLFSLQQLFQFQV